MRLFLCLRFELSGVWGFALRADVRRVYAADVLVNVVLGGDRRDTISSRLGKGQLAGKPVHTLLASVVNILFILAFKESNHCKNSIANIDDCYAISSILARHR